MYITQQLYYPNTCEAHKFVNTYNSFLERKTKGSGGMKLMMKVKKKTKMMYKHLKLNLFSFQIDEYLSDDDCTLKIKKIYRAEFKCVLNFFL